MGAEAPTPIDEARRIVLSHVRRLESERVPVADALGRVLAVAVSGSEDVPGFDNSAMDGYAVIAADTAGASAEVPVDLSLSGESRAGHPAERALRGGEAIAISTGAVVPEGADAVVRVEDTEQAGDQVLIRVAVEPGRDIRRAGEDVRRGDELVAAGALLGPAELGVLVSAAAAEVACSKRPRLALVATGDELLGPGDEMRPGGVRNSNAYTVPALARLAGAEVVSVERAADTPEATADVLGRALARADVVVVCGGVSVGPHDHVRPAFAELGVEERFWGVSLRPGKPTWFGGGDGGPLAFGLPGNPVSAFVTFVLFVRPALAALQGADPAATRGSAILDASVRRMAKRTQAVRCSLEARPDGWHASITGPQGSHILTSMLGADALATIEPGEGELAAGERVEFEFLRFPGFQSPRLVRINGMTAAESRFPGPNGGNGPPENLAPMRVRVRLFAILRERAGTDTVEIDVCEGETVAEAIRALSAYPALAEILGRMPVTLAVNREYASEETVLEPGDEIALIPPVSGGATVAGVHARVTSEPLSIEALSAAVGRPGAGALVVFCGVTREVERLEYEAYEEMALERIERIAADCLVRHSLEAIAAEHRTGAVGLGEPSVVVAASAAHRAEAFAGAREAIDRIKAEAPIWKKEADGPDTQAEWVQGTPPPVENAQLTHLDREGTARMVDVGSKPQTQRIARARAIVRMTPATAAVIAAGDAPKGDVLGPARFAGIQAAKRTWELIPLAHPLVLDYVDVEASVDEINGEVRLEAEARITSKTGVEMEAMTACSVAALTVYDMVKGIERGVSIERVELLAKSGGRSGVWRRED